MSKPNQYLDNFDHPVFGVSVHAFGRIGCEKIFPDFKIICLNQTGEIKEMRKRGLEVFCLQEQLKKKPGGKRNPSTLLKNAGARRFIQGNSGSKRPILVLYKSTPYIDALCHKNGWIPAANSHKIFNRFNNKLFFKSVLEKLMIPSIPGKVISLKNLDYKTLSQEFPQGFVVQKPVSGGGGGTFFVHAEKDFNRTLAELSTSPDLRPGSRLNITRFVKGYSPSITACVTRRGTLCLAPQIQLIDIADLNAHVKGNGVFCGHDWSAAKEIHPSATRRMQEIAEKIGLFLQEYGYKGIFGIDFLVDHKTNEVFPVEINPRLLGVFPVSTMLQLEAKESPLLLFHVLEFAGSDYSVDVEAVNKSFNKEPKEGAHFFLYAPYKPCRTKALPAGVYGIKKDGLVFLRPGFSFDDIRNKNEFLLVDGAISRRKVMRKSGPLRMLRVVTKNRVSSHMGRKLNTFGAKIARLIYKRLAIEPVK